MAIINRNNGPKGNIVFIDLKGVPQAYIDENDGKKFGALVLSHGKDQPKEVLPSNSSITGYLTAADVQTREYQGDEISSLKLRFEDPNGADAPVQLTVTLGSYFSAKVVGLLNAADLNKPVTVNAYVVMAGDKIGDKVFQKDNVFPTLCQGADQARLTPVWAGGVTELPETTTVKINGKLVKDMGAINDLTAQTIAEIYAKLPQVADGDDHGLEPDEVQQAANSAPQRQRQ